MISARQNWTEHKEVTVVANKYKQKWTVDCVYIGRPTIYGNPFAITPVCTREEVIKKYREYFWNRIHTDAAFLSAILKLKDKTLMCFCKPLPCHGDVIAEFPNSQYVKEHLNVPT